VWAPRAQHRSCLSEVEPATTRPLQAVYQRSAVRPLGLEPRTCGLRVGVAPSHPVSARSSASRFGWSSGCEPPGHRRLCDELGDSGTRLLGQMLGLWAGLRDPPAPAFLREILHHLDLSAVQGIEAPHDGVDVHAGRFGDRLESHASIWPFSLAESDNRHQDGWIAPEPRIGGKLASCRRHLR
jgi:hypothetical protein